MFTYVYVITNGGPGFSTYSAEFFIYDTAFTFRQLGYASAAGVILTLVLAVLGFFQIRWITGGQQRMTTVTHDQAAGRRRAAGAAPGSAQSGGSAMAPPPRRRSAADHFRARRARASARLPALFHGPASLRTQPDWDNSELGLPDVAVASAVPARLDWAVRSGSYLRNSFDHHGRARTALSLVVSHAWPGYSFSP